MNDYEVEKIYIRAATRTTDLAEHIKNSKADFFRVDSVGLIHEPYDKGKYNEYAFGLYLSKNPLETLHGICDCITASDFKKMGLGILYTDRIKQYNHPKFDELDMLSMESDILLAFMENRDKIHDEIIPLSGLHRIDWQTKADHKWSYGDTSLHLYFSYLFVHSIKMQ